MRGSETIAPFGWRGRLITGVCSRWFRSLGPGRFGFARRCPMRNRQTPPTPMGLRMARPCLLFRFRLDRFANASPFRRAKRLAPIARGLNEVFWLITRAGFVRQVPRRSIGARNSKTSFASQRLRQRPNDEHEWQNDCDATRWGVNENATGWNRKYDAPAA